MMDNLPNLQRSVSKFFDSRRKSQKRQKTAAAAATSANSEFKNEQQLKTDQTTAQRNANNVNAHQANIENTTIRTSPANTLNKSTGAIKKKSSIKSHNEKHQNKLRFFSRNNSSDKKHLKLPPTTTEQSQDLDKPQQILECVRNDPQLNVRPAHFALAQLRSSNDHLANATQIHHSPEGPTPPEFAYHHLGSVTTTNSNTSLESSFGELGETSTTNTKTTNGVAVSNTSASNVCYWAWQQTIATVASASARNATTNCETSVSAAEITANMNYDLYSETFATTTTPTTTTTIAADTKRGRRSPLLKMPVIKQSSAQTSTTEEHEETTSSIKNTTTTTMTTNATNSKPPSRSGSASKLMNFLFKSSNESNKSLQGQSNEGFTASSHGSSSGEWEYLGAVGGIGHTRMEIESLPEETHMNYLATDEAGSYFQYTLSSPNNPFLPEIVARSYHSTCDSQEFELPTKTSCIMHTHSQLPTPAYSRAGSTESTRSEGAIPAASEHTSPATSSSRAGRQRRKLFSLHSPRFLQQRQQEPSTAVTAASSTTTVTATTTTTTTTNIVPLLGVETANVEHDSFIRSLNPFSTSAHRTSSHGTLPKRGFQRFASKVNTPATVSADLGTKREEFLRATMKICLVVSPPNTKLQIKSKSLTHLDGLDRTVTYQHGDKSANCITPLTQNIVGGENNIISATTNAAGKLNHTESGTEYFQISFYGDANVLEDDELIPVKKGMKLCNALNPSLKKRNLSFSKIAIIDQSELIDSDKPVQTLDKNTSVEHLAGHHLVVTQQDYRKTTLQKAASFGAGTRPSRLLSSASTEETSEQTLNSSSKVKNRWSGLFGVRNAQYAQLCDLLNTFSRTGVPQQPETILYLEHPSFADAMQYLSNMHNSWTDFIDYKNMSENDKKIQTAIWELVTTEVFYIQTLQTVTNLFLACLLSVQEYNILKDVDQNKLFSNVREICFANLRFWTMSLYPMVAHSVATKEPMRIIFFQQGFASFGALFTPYKRYCAEQSTCQYYCKELYRTNVLFTSYLAWCESHKMCNRLRLADILVRPMQRLTKYSLLLTAIRKQLYSIHEVELVDFMIQSVENFVCSVNSHLTIRQEHERLKGVMARIESYDVVPETNNEHLDRMLKQFSRMFDLCMPMKGCPAHHVRHLFMEGDHKYKDYTGKHDVHCFLMTDMLMVCKAASRKTVGQLKVIRQPYITDRLVVHLQNNVLSCVYLNEYQVAVSAFTLTCLEARSWYDSLKRARNIYTRLKQSVLNMTPSTASHNVPSAPFTTEYANYGTPYAYPQMFSNSNSTMAADGSVTGTSLAATESVVCCIPPEGLDSTSAVTSTDPLGIMFRKSPLSSSSVCSHISSTNASKSGSVEWNESRNISVEMEKTNSLSSDDGVTNAGAHGVITALIQGKHMITGHKSKAPTTTSLSSLSLQPPVIGHLGQSLPNLTTHQSHTNLYHTYSNNTLLVPGTSSTHSGNLLLSPSHRGISYPPPSPTRVPLRRGFAFSTSMKNPPLVKTRNITSQNSSSWRHMFSSSIQPTATTTTTVAASGTIPSTTNPPSPTHAPYIYTTTSIAETPCSKLTTTPLLLTNDDIAEETVDHSLDD